MWLSRGVVEVREVQPADEVGLARWHAALTAGALAGRTAATVSSLGAMRASLGSPSPVRRRLAVGAWEGRECVGALLLELPLRTDLTTAEAEIDVPVEHRGAGVGDSLWRWALERASAEGRSVLQAEVAVPEGQSLESWPGARFARARGFGLANVEDHLVADLPFDTDRLAWLEAAALEDGYRVEAWQGRCPEPYVAAWAELRTAMSVDVPTGELTREAVATTMQDVRTSEERMERSFVLLHALALDAAGVPVGYSSVFLPRDDPEHALQDDTLVLRADRGHGLGARLKAANLRGLAALLPAARLRRRWLHTYTAKGNVAMQTVNARFGFRRVEVLHELERPAAG